MTGLHVVVTGASRGLGLEFVKQLLARGDTVGAAARSPGKSAELQALAKQYPSTLKLITLDVLDTTSVAAAAAKLAEDLPCIDLLINNAGILGDVVPAFDTVPEQFRDVLLTNAIGPFLVIKALMPLILKSTKKQVVQISSTMGSIGSLQKNLKSSDEQYAVMSRSCMAYRASKSALNMETVALAVDMKGEGVTVISMCPGWVATDMGNTPAGVVGSKPELDAPTSIAMQLKVIDALTLEQTGSFLNHTGKVVPW